MNTQSLEGHGISCNIFVIEGERTALIDAGTIEDSKANINRIRQLGIRPEILILTHRHVDHIGGAKRISDAFGINEIYAGSKDADAIRNADESTGAKDFGLGIEPVDVLPVSEGDYIDLGSSGLKVLETPGHTIGSISLLDEGERALFSGDTVFADGGVGRWDLPTGDIRMLKTSVERLVNLGLSFIYPGHGRSVSRDAKSHILSSLSSLEYYLPSSFSDSERF